MYFQGIFETDLQFAMAKIHFGKKDGTDFGQISFPNLGDMNNDVKSIIIHEDSIHIVFDLNNFDLNIEIKNNGGEWIGKIDLDAAGLHSDIALALISSEPEFREHNYVLPEGNVKILKEHHTYDFHPCEPVFEYELHNPDVLQYIKSMGITVENHHDFETVRKLMQLTSASIHHDGVNYCHDREHRGTIAQIEFAKKQDRFTNCRGLAIIMHGVLRAYGFKANLVECWPDQSDTSDIHVVCEVYVDDLKKTVLIDPSNNLIYYQNGIPVNLFELRSIIVNDEIDSLTINDDAMHNNEKIDMMQMLAYMSKNLVYLNKGIITNEALELAGNSVCLAPKSLVDRKYPDASMHTANVNQFYF